MVIKTAFVSRKAWYAIGARILDLVEGCSHVGILHPIAGGKYMVSDMTGDGFKITNLEQWQKKYKIRAIIHTHLPVPYSVHPNSLHLIDEIALKFGPGIYKTRYAHAQLLWDGLEIVSQWFGGPEWKAYINGKRKQVCSEWAARFHHGYGQWVGDPHFDVITLKDCYEGLKKVAIKIEGGL